MSQHQPGLFLLGDGGQERRTSRHPPLAPAPSHDCPPAAALHSRPPRPRPTLLPRRLSPVYQGGALQKDANTTTHTNDSLLTDSPASTLSSAALFSPATLEPRDMTTMSFVVNTMSAPHAGQPSRSWTGAATGLHAMPLSLPPRPGPTHHASSSSSSTSRLPLAALPHTALVKPSTVPTRSLLDEPRNAMRGVESAGSAPVVKRVRRSCSSASTRGSSAGSSVLTAPVLRRKCIGSSSNNSPCCTHGELAEYEEEDETVRNTCATSCLSSQGLSRCIDSRGTTMDGTATQVEGGGVHTDGAATTTTRTVCDEQELHCDSLTIDEAALQRHHTSATLSAETHVRDGVDTMDGLGNEEGKEGATTEMVVVSAELLRRLLSCHDDLDHISSAELHVDTERWIGVDRLSSLLPHLNALKLNRSHIPQLRLLGSRYNALRYLWLNNCHLAELRGIGACAPQLRELYVAFNKLVDLSPLMDLAETLQVLDAEANELAEVQPLRFVLAALRQVTSLTLQGNPVVFDETLWASNSSNDDVVESEVTDHLVLHEDHEPDTSYSRGYVASYQAWVRGLMPQLCTLDDVPLHELGKAKEDAETGASTRSASILHDTSSTRLIRPMTAGANTTSVYVDPLDVALVDELRLVQDCLRDCGYDALDAALDEQNRPLYARPSTSCGGPRPSRGGGGATLRPATSTAVRDAEGKSTASHTVAEASTLTTGGVFAGSAIASLRRRLGQPAGWTGEAASVQKAGLTMSNTETSRLSDTAAAESARASCESAAVRHDDDDNEDDARISGAEDNNDTSDEDEWERYKTALMRERLGSASSAFTRTLLQECQDLNTQLECSGETADALNARLPSRAHYMQLALREIAAEREDAAGGATRPITAAGLSASGATPAQPRQSSSVTAEEGEVHREGVCNSSSSHCHLSMTTASGMSLRDLLVMTPLQRRQGTSRRGCGGTASRQRVGSSLCAERDVLDELVRKEVSRSRVQIARASVDHSDGLENNPFLAHRDRFEVIALNSIPEHRL